MKIVDPVLRNDIAQTIEDAFNERDPDFSIRMLCDIHREYYNQLRLEEIVTNRFDRVDFEIESIKIDKSTRKLDQTIHVLHLHLRCKLWCSKKEQDSKIIRLGIQLRCRRIEDAVAFLNMFSKEKLGILIEHITQWTYQELIL